MALVKFGAGVSEMRGKEGGVVYSKNAGGNYIKTKVTPTNPQTGYQTAARSRLQGISQSWKDLTEVQKNAWDALGAQVMRVNVFGDSLPYTGYTLFMRLNLNLQAVEQSIIEDAPSIPTLDTLVISAVTLEKTPDNMLVVFTPSQSEKSTSVVCYATGLIVSGRRFVKNLRKLVMWESETEGSLDFKTEWQARYGALALGAKIFVGIKLVDEATGFDSTLVVSDGTVVAGA